MAVLLIVLGLLLGFMAWEYQVHLRNLRKVPTRIHVNGTRGKSSVTRLIAAGLRAGGVATCAKTTGSRPRMILEDGSEYSIQRQGRANILEQLRAVAVASRRGAHALVAECMALSPALQVLSEEKMIRSSIGVITNVRADHLDVMGPAVEDVARALGGAMPKDNPLVTAENDPALLEILREAAEKQRTKLVCVTPGAEGITEEIMRKFPYVEHSENVAVACKVCELAGVEREQALEGMFKATPDIGALRIIHLAFFAKQIDFIHAFAANDPESTLAIWNRVLSLFPGERRHVAILNCREDRPQRSVALGKILPTMKGIHRILLTGSGTRMAMEAALKNGMHPEKLIVLEKPRPEDVFERAVAQIIQTGTVFGMGNIGGGGTGIIEYFENRAEVPKDALSGV
ncbi:poly-gamma-glutamate synthase PgsB [Myxococcota bacterium]